MIDALTALMLDLREQGREDDEDHVMDVLDFLTGWGWNGGRVWKSKNSGS